MKDFIYGIAAVKMGTGSSAVTLGYIEKGSFDWGGTKPESTDIEAEQVPDAPVISLMTKNGQLAPTFNLIQLNYTQIQKVLGGALVTSGTGGSAVTTGWKAPTSLVEIRDSFEIEFVSGQKMTIPNGQIMANLGGKLTLTEVSKIECQLKVNKPSDGGSPYEINDVASSGD